MGSRIWSLFDFYKQIWKETQIFFFFLSVSVLLLMCLFRSVLDLFEKRDVKILSKFVKLG